MKSHLAGVSDPLVEQCLEQLRSLSFVRRITLAESRPRETDVDLYLEIEVPKGRFSLPCEIKRSHVGRETAHHVAHVVKRRPGLILMANTIGPGVADILEQAEVNFVDAAGNCNIRLGERYVARVQGRATIKRARTDRGLRAPAYRVLFCLLAREDSTSAPSRLIASDASVSPQTANELRRWLIDQGFMLRVGRRLAWAPRRRKDAIALWLSGFTTTLAPSLLIGRFRSAERDPVDLEQRIQPILDAACEWRYGGGAAATRLMKHYRGDHTSIYARDPPHDLWMKLRFVRDPSGPIALLRPPCRTAFSSPEPRSVHPLLAYADLLAEGHDRAREAAGELYSRFLIGPEDDE